MAGVGGRSGMARRVVIVTATLLAMPFAGCLGGERPDIQDDTPRAGPPDATTIMLASCLGHYGGFVVPESSVAGRVPPGYSAVAANGAPGTAVVGVANHNCDAGHGDYHDVIMLLLVVPPSAWTAAADSHVVVLEWWVSDTTAADTFRSWDVRVTDAPISFAEQEIASNFQGTVTAEGTGVELRTLVTSDHQTGSEGATMFHHPDGSGPTHVASWPPGSTDHNTGAATLSRMPSVVDGPLTGLGFRSITPEIVLRPMDAHAEDDAETGDST